MKHRVHRFRPALETATVVEQCPLCVDLDGTLIRSDTLHESILDGLRQNPLGMAALPLWVIEGRARFKQRVADHCQFDASTLPYRDDILDALRQARAQGRELVLVTAANRDIAAAVAAHLGIFDRIIASSDSNNLKGAAKRDALDKLFGEGGWDYVGDSEADLEVWAGARRAWVAGSVEPADAIVERRFEGRTTQSSVRAFIRAIRPYQWVKNVLIFLPFLLGHRWMDWRCWLEALVSFVAFSFVASAGYLINDLLDRRDDRRHDRKKHRPFASGDLPLSAGLAAPVLLAAALLLCLALPFKCALIVCVYFLATISYSLALKKVQLVDVLTLACLYSVRLVMGSEATGTPISLWLLRFSLFMFLTLALAKRVAELRMLEQLQSSVKTFGRGYRIGDLPLLEAMGVGAGYMAALVMVLYVEGSGVEQLYPHANYLWLMLPVLLFWISHLWLTAHRGELPDDPILFAFRDKKSLMTGAAAVLCVVAASL
ncbi:MAG TPA: UbiA family prenyltransferase [Bryobacteraceae bacterium]